MRVDSIHLTNYRCHEDLQVAFAPGFNVLVGVNGSGKTSLLKGLCDSLMGLVVGMSHHHTSPLSEPGSARLSAVASHGRYRFETHYPIKVSAGGEAFGVGCVWTYSKSSQVNDAQLSGQVPGHIWRNIQSGPSSSEAGQAASTSLPLVAFYRANRNWNQPQPHELQAATEKSMRIDGYRSWWDASVDSVALQGWAIAKCLERFQTSSEIGVPFESIVDDELALVNRALELAVEGV